MKYGAHCYLFIDKWTDNSVELFEKAGEIGLDFLEISVGDDVSFSTAPVRKKMAETGIEVTIGPGAEWPMQCDLSSDNPEERLLGLEWHKKQVDLCHEIGAIAYAGAIYGHAGMIKRRPPPPEEYQYTAEGLHLLGEYAAEKGVVVVLEPMSHFRTHLVNTPEQMLRLVKMSDHPNLKISLDTYHLVTEIVDYHEAILTVKDYLWGMHMCENNRGVPGRGIVPWEQVFTGLTEIGFESYMLFESYNSSIEKGTFAFSRGMFHDVCADGADFVKEGISFIEEGMAAAAGN
ncbi:MAG: sugar phosphate isomerase/epimerase [Opitutaceae bacterium]|nr:sugar phosphate isomerase/epimerase [Opitutaceae bacterium]